MKWMQTKNEEKWRLLIWVALIDNQANEVYVYELMEKSSTTVEKQKRKKSSWLIFWSKTFKIRKWKYRKQAIMALLCSGNIVIIVNIQFFFAFSFGIGGAFQNLLVHVAFYLVICPLRKRFAYFHKVPENHWFILNNFCGLIFLRYGKADFSLVKLVLMPVLYKNTISDENVVLLPTEYSQTVKNWKMFPFWLKNCCAIHQI